MCVAACCNEGNNYEKFDDHVCSYLCLIIYIEFARSCTNLRKYFSKIEQGNSSLLIAYYPE